MRMLSLERLKIDKQDQYLCALCDEGHVTSTPFFRHGFAALTNASGAVLKYIAPAAYDYEAKQRIYDAVVRDNNCEWCVTEQLLKVVSGIRQQWRTFK